jgi:UDP-N-acetylmuramate dehydrogenase
MPLAFARVGLSAASPSRLRFACRFGGSATIPLAAALLGTRPHKKNKKTQIKTQKCLQICKTALSLHQHFCVYLFGFLGLCSPIRGAEFFFAQKRDKATISHMKIQHMKIQQNISLLRYNSFAVEASAAFFATINTVAELLAILSPALNWAKQPILVLGEGSNMLFASDVGGLVLLNRISGREIIRETANEVSVRFGAGENWHDTVTWAVQNNYGGLENLSLIPGTVGAAPIQNIGAYGVEIGELLESVEAIEIATATQKKFAVEECDFGYRDSAFKSRLHGQYIISHVTLRLQKNPTTFNLAYKDISETITKLGYASPSLVAVYEAVIAIRQQKLYAPKDVPNAGSFFKNPIVAKITADALKEKYPDIPIFAANEQVKISAAWLIDKAGWKGRKLGEAAVSDKHALVLTNPNFLAKGAEVWALAEAIQADVLAKFGVRLSPEVWQVRAGKLQAAQG